MLLTEYITILLQNTTGWLLSMHHKPYGDSRGMGAWQLREVSGLCWSWLIYPCSYGQLDRGLWNVQCSGEEKNLLAVPGIEPKVHYVY